MLRQKVSIIILTWNGIDYTKKCLRTLKPSVENEENVRVYVVDNGSSDQTPAYLKTLDWITLIRNDTNTGFVRGNNRAINRIPDGDIVLLNNDMIIGQADWLVRLQAAAYEDPLTGIAGCRLTDGKGNLLHAGTYIYPETYWGQQIGGNQKDIGQYCVTREVEGVVFACAYIKREVIRKTGGLNERFFSYFEDTDYCLSARKAGFRVVCAGDVTLTHCQNVSSSVNEVNFSEMFEKSRKVFKKIWHKELCSKYTEKMAWNSIVNFSSGYAVSAKNMMLALDDLNVDIRYRYVYGKGTPFPVEEPAHSDDYRINIIKNRKFDKRCPQVVYGQGDVFERNSGKYRIGFTMLETTGIPKEWVRQCNQMDEIWVPSAFNKNTFRNSGVRVPVHVVPLGVDMNYYNPGIRSYKKHSKFTFLSVFEWGERKAPEILLRAYSRAFAAKEDVVLICKVMNRDPQVHVREQIRKLGISGCGPEIIVLYNTRFEDYEMAALYRSADCFVLSTRGEGWGMPILEAMACGLPVIATDWSAQTDFFNESNGYPVNVKKLVDAKAKCPYYQGFQWAEPDEDHLVEQMRYVYEHQNEAKYKGEKAAREAAEKWTWKHTAEIIRDRIVQL